MKKKLLSVGSLLVAIFCLSLLVATDIKASSEPPKLDGSYLTYDMESIGYAMQLTKGIDLLNGYSKIVRKGPGSIYVGGTTLAAHTVNKVKISVMVERAAEKDDTWSFVDGWSAEALDTDRVAANRGLAVDGNYYYRVRCIHSANQDVSSSFTNGVFIEEPGSIFN